MTNGKYYRSAFVPFAIQWDGQDNTWEEIVTLIDGEVSWKPNSVGRFFARQTERGRRSWVDVDIGYWLVKEAPSMFRILSDEEFKALYVAVEDTVGVIP